MALATSIVSYWKLDDASGNAIDAHASNDGVVTSATQGETGILNDCYLFDGTNDYITVPDNSALDIDGTKSFSISAWVKTTDTGAEYLFNKRYTDGAGAGWSVLVNGGYLDTYWKDSTGQTIASTNDGTQVNDGDWHHVGLSFNLATGSLTRYVDGSQTGTVDTNTNLDDMSNARSFYIGCVDAPASFFSGNIDEIGIWAKVLTADEFTELYNGGIPLAYPFLKSKLNIGDSWKIVEGAQVNIGDVWKAVAGMQINIGDDWKTIF